MAPLSVRRGDDERYLATFRTLAGTIQDLTGVTVFFTVKPSAPSSPTADLNDESAFLKYHWQHDGSSVISSEGMRLPGGATPGDGQLEVIFPRSLTTTWGAVNHPYEVQITLPDAESEGGQADKTWDSGDFMVTLDLNRRRTP